MGKVFHFKIYLRFGWVLLDVNQIRRPVRVAGPLEFLTGQSAFYNRLTVKFVFQRFACSELYRTTCGSLFAILSDERLLLDLYLYIFMMTVLVYKIIGMLEQFQRSESFTRDNLATHATVKPHLFYSTFYTLRNKFFTSCSWNLYCVDTSLKSV